MNQLVLTREDILTDIEGFEERIQAARDHLAALQTNAPSSHGRKRWNQKRRALHSEIKHVIRLRSYAEDALREITD